MADKSQVQAIQKKSPEVEKRGQTKSTENSIQAAQPEWLSQAVRDPSRARPEDILELQRRFGNQVVQRVLEPTIRRQAVTNERGDLQPELADEIRSASQGGQPLPAGIRQNMSQQLGHDFSGVHIHTDRRSDILNRQLQARAFTLGNNIFFSQGAFDPQSTQGRHTLTHELTHVVQQSGGVGGSGPLKLGKPDDSYEKEADRVAASREAASQAGLAAGAGVIQRMPSWKGIKSFFSSGSSAPAQPQGGVAAIAAPSTQLGAAAVPVSAQPPAVVAPAGMPPAVWEKLLTNGISNKTVWLSISETRRNTIIASLAFSQKLTKQLVDGALQNEWPTDISSAELTSAAVIYKIFKSGNLSIANWNLLGARRSCILDCFINNADALGNELLKAAASNTWPKDGADAEMLAKDQILSIKNNLKTSLNDWSKFTTVYRLAILTAYAAAPEQGLELAKAAKANDWPKDGSDQAFSTYAPWGEIKAAVSSLQPAQWNKFDAVSRGNILTAATPAEKTKLIKQGLYAINKGNTLLEKAGEFAENPIIEGLSGTAGTASSITGAMENDKASGIVGATADAADTLVNGISLFGAISKFRRGKRVADQNPTSRAAQSLGKKGKREGIWGMAQSTLGLGGSISSMVGNVSKGKNPDQDEDNGTSETTDKISGSFAIAAGAMGSVKGGMGLFKSFRRSSRTKEYIDETATGDKKKLSDIASFTQKKQNRLGRSFETFKGLSTVLGGVSSILGNDVFGSVMGGLGLLSGIGQAIATKAGEPDEAALGQRAADLVDLIQGKNLDAIKFARDVLNINDVTPDTPDEWSAWVQEDRQAAIDLIMSKLSKH